MPWATRWRLTSERSTKFARDARRAAATFPPMSLEVERIEIVEDRTAESRCDEGFLRVRRLRLRNHYRDGSSSGTYPCDVVSRRGSDAVVAVIYERTPDARIDVVLREAARAPIYLRRHATFEHPDPREYTTLTEVVAGIVETGDGSGPMGRAVRAAAEVREEAGLLIDRESFRDLGGETFATPGTSDEKIYFCVADASGADAEDTPGDGSVMEEAGRVVRRELRRAIAACRAGEIPDMKTEVALLRLADYLGYLPQLDCFADELPETWRARYDSLGAGGTR